VLEILLLVLIAIVGLLYEHRARNRDSALYRPPGKLIDIGGYRLHLSCAGERGPTVVLEYGLQASYFDWRLVQPEIANFTRVCFYDRAGYGWSDRSSRPRIPSVMADELHTLLHTAGEKPPFILVSHSFGSYNAVMFTHKFRDEVSGLVLVDGLHTFSDFPFSASERVSLKSMQFLMSFGLPRWRKWCGGAGPATQRGERQAVLCRPGLYAAFYRERAALPQSVAEMRTIDNLGSVPLIVIAHDPKILHGSPGVDDWDHVQQQKLQLSRNSELIVATGSGHDIPLARPDVIVAAVKKLVAQASGTGGQPGKSFK
jgi:pimeloyl-ACP methyl ester carboxylesterase